MKPITVTDSEILTAMKTMAGHLFNNSLNCMSVQIAKIVAKFKILGTRVVYVYGFCNT